MKKQPATPEEMRRFLRSEGWRYRRIRSQGNEHWYWVDPVTDIHWVRILAPYCLAKHRKSARESRQLRKAGAEWAKGVRYGGLEYWAWWRGSDLLGLTRQEALSKLAEGRKR